MESFDFSELKPGDKLLVKTETGSIYHLDAEIAPDCRSEAGNLFGGFIITRESDHHFASRPEWIEKEHSLIIIRSGRDGSELRAGDYMEVIWDKDHPDSKENWDIQFGPRFHTFATSRVVDIEFVPVQE